MSALLWILGALAAAIFSGIAAFTWWGKPKAVPDKVENIGCFQVVTHTYFFRTGWNQGRLGWGRDEYYSIRADGKKLEILAGNDRFNAIFLFPSSRPAAVINSGDPNNTSRYHLLLCEEGRPVLKELGNSASASVSAVWLDPGQDDEMRVDNFSRLRRMGPGRLLLLGGTMVLDTETFEWRPVPEPQNWEFSVNQFSAPISLSPDGQSFARFGSTRFPENHPCFAVYNFVTGASYHLRLDRKRMRYNLWEELDRAWFNHHFEWTKVPGEPDRLRERPSFQPLPYRGYRTQDVTGHREYRLMNVAVQMADIVEALLVKEFGAKRLPDQLATWRQYEIQGRKVNMGTRHERSDAYVALHIDRGQDSALVFEMGDRIDHELATGRWDHLFHRDPE